MIEKHYSRHITHHTDAITRAALLDTPDKSPDNIVSTGPARHYERLRPRRRPSHPAAARLNEIGRRHSNPAAGPGISNRIATALDGK